MKLRVVVASTELTDLLLLFQCSGVSSYELIANSGDRVLNPPESFRCDLKTLIATDIFVPLKTRKRSAVITTSADLFSDHAGGFLT